MNYLVGILLICTLSCYAVGQQEKGAIVLTNKALKERRIKEFSRIKIVDNQGNKYRGKFEITTDSTILVQGKNLNIKDIEVLKHNRNEDIVIALFVSAVSSLVLISSYKYYDSPFWLDKTGANILRNLAVVGFISSGVALCTPQFNCKDKWEIAIEQ